MRVIDNDDLSEREYFAKVIFVCTSTIGSTQILMNSTSKKFPNGIANSSGVLGHYLMDHNYNSVASGDIDGCGCLQTASTWSNARIGAIPVPGPMRRTGVRGSFGSRKDESRTKTRQHGHASRLLPFLPASVRLPDWVEGGSRRCSRYRRE